MASLVDGVIAFFCSVDCLSRKSGCQPLSRLADAYTFQPDRIGGTYRKRICPFGILYSRFCLREGFYSGLFCHLNLSFQLRRTVGEISFGFVEPLLQGLDFSH
ncbi:hypothetical protein BHK69_15860 [Bosea vaviloviae]|uniref:Uncharacterized protein n=1 Tax=Bosea vaviloviae TaxID=1526658 RepID=A0A1D7U2Y6_9HYPH|nr:hypothetical protein BHK69_15860 [Bosea vaviloviae]